MRLLEAETNEVVWSESYEVPLAPGAIMSLRRDVSSRIATVLGQPYGAISEDLRARDAALAPESIGSYLCVLRSYNYRRSFSAAAFAPMRACLEAAVERDPAYADAWAMLGWIYMDDGRFGFSGGEAQSLYRQGEEAAARAIELEPDNVLALKALSSIRHYMGRYEEAEALARRGAELNPHDPDTLAQLGWRLAARGNFAEGIPLLQQAIERSLDPPGWYFHLLAMHRYFQGDYEAMLTTAQRSARDGSQYSQALIALAALRLARPDQAASAAAKVPSDSVLRQNPGAFFARHGTTEAIAQEMVAGLREAFAFGDSTDAD
ncbi:tetratricopeptide repeat protein [Afifella pfennigii]|uniref:tetratricopeptide repeat protein n=1 Tax=Afifella pfennigii TaxID=209897 RepID=UPI0012EB3551|nr:tetratricopeptide repeat protein [Afifella pfennigii]